MTDATSAGPGTQFHSIPVEITVSVGKAQLPIGELLTLGSSAVLALDKRVEDPVELFVGDRLIARGVLEEVDAVPKGQLAVRLIEVTETSVGNS